MKGLFGGCNCEAELTALRTQNKELRGTVELLAKEVEVVEKTAIARVIEHFEGERKKALARKQEERDERSKRLTIPSL